MASEQSTDRVGDYIQVYSGHPFWPLDPRASEVDIRDIAHALANQCRFSGHVRRFYSVAQHSFHVSLACESKDALWGLLHDAAEAYTLDMPRPLKQHSAFAPYLEVEALIMRSVCERFGLPPEMPPSVKQADDALLAAEVHSLMTPCEDIWGKWISTVMPWSGTIEPMDPDRAKVAFLERFFVLTNSSV
jgi:uncharacterized protein